MSNGCAADVIMNVALTSAHGESSDVCAAVMDTTAAYAADAVFRTHLVKKASDTAVVKRLFVLCKDRQCASSVLSLLIAISSESESRLTFGASAHLASYLDLIQLYRKTTTTYVCIRAVFVRLHLYMCIRNVYV